MTRSTVIAVLLVVLVFSVAPAREWVPFTDTPLSEEVAASITSADLSATVIEVEVPGMMVEPAFRGMPGSVDLAIPGARPMSSPGMPDVPVLSYLLAVPDHGDVRLEIVELEERVLHGYDIAPARPFEFEGHEPIDATADPAVYSRDAFYPSDVASIGEPGVLRDLRLADVRINPVRYNPATREVSVVERIKVRVVTDGGQGANPKRVTRDYRSAAFEPIYAAMVDNYDELPRAEVRRGSYLVITVDDYVAALADFVEWKQQRGIETELVPLSAIGTSPTNVDIKAYIQNAYDTWPNPPDYVLLVGDSTTSDPYGTMPCWYLPAIPFNHVVDHPYSELDGGDYFPDVIVGRMSVDSPTEALVACMKVLSYERDCDGPNNTWYKNALMVAGNYGATPPPTSPRQTTLRVREMLYDYGYAQVDTIFYPPYITPNPIGATIDAGVGIVNYRGWGNDAGWHYPEYYTDDIQALSNGNALPLMMSCVCGSNAWESWGYDPCFGEAWIRAGSPGDLKGGPAMIGASDRNTHTRWNNAVGSGIFQGILYEDIEHFGQMLVRGKLEVWKWFIDERDPGDWVEYYHNIYSVMGDPELWLRLDSPGSFTVECDTTIPAGQNFLTLDVSDASRGGVVSGVEVAVRTPGVGIETVSGGNDTRITVPIYYDGSPHTHEITVMASDYVPYQVTASHESPADISVALFGFGVDDDNTGASSGNGDGIPNPGETIELSVELMNHGSLEAPDVTCELTALPSDGMTVTWGNVSFGAIPPGGTALGSEPFVLFVEEGTPLRSTVTLTLSPQSSGQLQAKSKIDLTVEAPTLEFYSVDIGGDGVLDPGETATLTVTLENTGGYGATSVGGTLRTPPSGLTAGDDTGYWGTVSASGMATNSGNTFTVTAAADVAVGHEFELAIDLSGDVGLSQWVVFPLVVGTAASDDPGGPDEHGYYVYDDTDTGYSEAPSYSWVELDPSYGGSGTDLGMAYDEMTNVALPFTFRFYGEEFTTIGICSNGNIGFGPQPVWEKQPRNTTIGAPLGPAGMAAPFWDDLNPNAAGKVLYQNLGGGRFAVEWSRVQTVYVDTTSLTPYLQTFELVLYDQDVYPTESGDGEILFQYHTIANADTANGATVGIENLNQTDGVEYSFFRAYPDHAAPLANGRAVKFTTDPPDAYLSTGVENAVTLGVKILGNRPNPFNPVTRIAFSVPMSAEVELSVYDISGRRVATLVSGEVEAGPHEVVWDGTSETGEPVASGVYFSRVKALGEEHSAKMVLLK